MKNNVPYVAVVLIWAATVAGAVYLAIHDHPWLALLLMLIGSGVNFKSTSFDDGVKKKLDEKKEVDPS